MRKLVLSLFAILTCAFQLSAQGGQITGTVTSEDGTRINGATVLVVGTSTGTSTDANGVYNITAPADGTLQFSFLGMETQEVRIGGRSRIDVVLHTDVTDIDDIIVVAYGTARRSSFTGSVSNISADALKTSRAETVDKSLVGKMSGVRVSQVTGDPGAGGQVQIRGIGSISGSTEPLYVVDGVPIQTGSLTTTRSITSLLTSVSTNDIESVTVLKDAAAASLYGSRAANGVVVITTKKGASGKPRVELNASFGWSDMATNSYEVMNGKEFYDYFNVVGQNYIADGFNLPSGYNNIAAILEDRNGEDWRDFIYKGGTDQNYQVSVTGGSDKTKYYVSLSYQDIEGLVRGTGMQRYSFTSNNSIDINRWLTFEGKAQLSYALTQGNRDNYARNQIEAAGIGSFSPAALLHQANPTADLKNADGSFNEETAALGAFYTPAYELGKKHKYLNNNNARALINANAEVRFTDWLKFRTVNGIDFSDIVIKEYWGPQTGDGNSVGGYGNRDNYRLISLTTSNTLQFAKTFGGHNNVDALAGYEVQKMGRDYNSGSVRNYPTDKLDDLSVGIPAEVSGSYSDYLMGSFFVNANYNYDLKYYIGANVRTDKTSRLSKENRNATFFSVSGAWRFSRENFLLDNSVLTDAKLRASFGTNGNLPDTKDNFATEYYQYMALYYYGGIYGGSSAIYPYQPANDLLGWEKSQNLNVGLDFTLFNRFSFNLEYYNKYTKDLLLKIPTSIVVGFPTALQNRGEISNRGFDFEFHGVDIVKSEVKWNSSLMLSTLKAKVEKLPDGIPINIGFIDNMYRYEEGKDLYSFYMPTWAGVDPQTGKGQFLKDPSLGNVAGNITTNYTEAQRSIVGKAYPNVQGGFNNSVSYKGVSLGLLLTYQFGGNLYDYWGYFAHSDGRRLSSGWNQSRDIVGNYWTKPGDVVDNPRPSLSNNMYDQMSTRWIKSTDFIRIKEISLSYSLPQKWVSGAGIENANIYLSVNNLVYIYAATKDMELEVPMNGFRGGDTPLARTITVGFNLSF